MRSSKVNDVIRKFLVNEGALPNPSIKSRLLALEDLLTRVEGKSLTEARKLEIIREQLKEVKREVKRLEEKNFLLEQENKELQEKLTLLEEGREE